MQHQLKRPEQRVDRDQHMPAPAAQDAVNRPSRARSLWMIGASLAFTGMATCIKLAAEHGVPTGQILFYRGAVSLLLMYLYLRLRRMPLATSHWKAHAIRSGFGLLAMLLYITAIVLLPLPMAVTLNYASPLILASMLLIIYRERAHPLMFVAMFGGLCGIVLLLRPTFDASQWLGGLVALGSAFTAAISALNIRALGKLNEPPARTVLYFSFFITLGALPFFLFSDPGSLSLDGALCVLGVGTLATAGQAMITLAYQRGHTMLVSLLGYSQVVFTSLIAVLLWNDQLSLLSWLGMALIIASGAAASMFTRPPVSSAS
jgi:drug/metabolite transporter (DMT)-like permease